MTPDRELQNSAIQSAEAAYRTWQRYDLIRVGHFSGSYHHHFVWLDLVTFLQGKSPESLEMVAKFAAAIAEYRAHAIFYEPNEASEELVDLLIRYAQDHRLGSFPKHVWPTSVVLDYSHLPTGNVGGITDEVRPNSLLVNAVFLDSIRVSGQLSARVRAHLIGLGYQDVLEVVILDRAQDVESDRLQPRVAWWTLSGPRLGSPRSCSLCHGRDAVNYLSAHTQSQVFSSTLASWSRYWTLGSIGEGGFPVLRDAALPQPVVRTLGRIDTPNITLASHHALATWTIELMSRLKYFSYVCERADRPDVPVRTAVTSAVLLHYWHDLHGAYQKRIFRMAVDQLWAESDSLQRSLLVLALASLPRRDLGTYVGIIRDCVLANGVPNLDVGLAAYALIHLAHGDQEARTRFLAAMRADLNTAAPSLETPWRRGRALLSLWTTSTGGELPYRSAMRVVGIPGRGLEHAYLYDLLTEIKDGQVTGDALVQILDEASALLEPVRAVVAQQEAEFARYRVREAVQGTFKSFEAAVEAYRVAAHVKPRKSGPTSMEAAV